LLQLLAGLLEPTAGRVQLEPQSLGHLAVGLVLQHPERQLVCGSAFDEVALGLRRARRSGHERDEEGESTLPQQVEAALSSVGLPPRQIGPRHPLRLSGGEQRRLAIAATLVLEPAFLLLDEPLAGLDQAGRRSIVDLLGRLRSTGCGLLIATHTVEPLIELADRVLVLADGRLVADGDRDAVLGEPAIARRAGIEPYPLAEAAEALGDRGWPKPDWLTPAAFVESLQHRGPSATPAGPQRISRHPKPRHG
jgi:energy-coupling factor transport system ATP-binding protein